MILFAPIVKAENWPQWRGTEYNGVSSEKGIANTWDESTNIAWTMKMPGRSGATPAVWGNHIFVTSSEGKDLVLMCISTQGKLNWKKTLGTTIRGNIKGDEANESSSSPSTDGKYVYAFVGSGDFACFDFQGNEIWKINVQERHGKFQILHGIHTTPLLYKDRLYLSLIHTGGHWVMAFDKATGREVWKVARKSDAMMECKDAYTSPCLWRDGNQAYIVVLGADYTTAHRLSDGQEVWRLTDLNPKTKYQYAFRIISSPVANEEMILVPTARNSQVIAVKPNAKGLIKAGSPDEFWRNPTGSPDVPSPLMHDGLVYLCSELGVLTCLDAKTGKKLYQESLHRTRYRASPVYVDGKIICTARDGTFTIVRAGPKFEKLETNTLEDVFTASPAISNGRIYLRGFQNLYAIEDRAK
jgi:outer membrane protein assembly factor BamB